MCNKLKCTRCKYELKGTENYCPICGLNLKEGTDQELPVKGLEMLCKLIAKHIKENYTPYCNIVISYNQIRIMEDVLCIPVKSND